jgi:hypothetical protein
MSNQLSNWPNPLSFKGQSINYLLVKLANASQIKQRLNSLKLYALQQLVNIDHTKSLLWKTIPHSTQVIPRGKEPKWFQPLSKTALEEVINKTQIEKFFPNQYIIHNTKTKEKRWAMLKIENKITVAEIKSTRTTKH